MSNIKEEMLKDALIAIRALLKGEYDNPQLMQYGDLSTDTDADILGIIQDVELMLEE